MFTGNGLRKYTLWSLPLDASQAMSHNVVISLLKAF
jgi:hypothetical protein